MIIRMNANIFKVCIKQKNYFHSFGDGGEGLEPLLSFKGSQFSVIMIFLYLLSQGHRFW